jgi:ATP-dependent Zn protease
LLREAADKATAMIARNRDKLDALAKRLEEVETLDEEEIEKLIGTPVYREAGTTR